MTLLPCLGALTLLLLMALPARAGGTLAGFRRSPWWDEQVRTERTEDGVRLLANVPAAMDPHKPTLLVVYATPNGNTAEQTLGCAKAPGLDWHFDIQHIAAQTRRLREVDRTRNIVLVVAQPENRSWPAWRRDHPNANARIVSLVENERRRFPGASVALTGHSGGGSFLFGFLEASEEIPDWVERIAFLDANYSFDATMHGGKLISWLRGDACRHLAVLAYDDRNITLDGKPVVGPDGGTWRASLRMEDRFAQDVSLTRSREGDLDVATALGGQVRFALDRNPQNRILHTVLVETNGFLAAMTFGTPAQYGWGAYRGARAYTRWIQPAESSAPSGTRRIDGIPPRPKDAPGGSAVMARVAKLPLSAREDFLRAEVLRGNIPDFLRTFKVLDVACINARGVRHTGQVAVMPDVLAVGSDADFVRIPLTPMTAQRIADAFGCSLMTRRLSDAVFRCAEVKLEPIPLTEAREAVETFVQHNALIEKERADAPLGRLVAGIKKDVVLTNQLAGKPGHVAIYGWHHPDGTPIQPLYTGHIATYVDYSHGIRLVARAMTVDGRPMDLADVLRDPDLCPLVSDEGVVNHRDTEAQRMSLSS